MLITQNASAMGSELDSDFNSDTPCNLTRYCLYIVSRYFQLIFSLNGKTLKYFIKSWMKCKTLNATYFWPQLQFQSFHFKKCKTQLSLDFLLHSQNYRVWKCVKQNVHHCKYITCKKHNFSLCNVSHALPMPFGHLITVPSTADKWYFQLYF